MHTINETTHAAAVFEFTRTAPLFMLPIIQSRYKTLYMQYFTYLHRYKEKQQREHGIAPDYRETGDSAATIN